MKKLSKALEFIPCARSKRSKNSPKNFWRTAKISEENELFMKNKEKKELTFVISDPKDVQEGRPQRQAVVPDQMGQHLALVRMHHPVKEHSCKNK